MSTKNHVQLIGHLGNDPELAVTESSVKVCNVNIATNHTFKSSTGERKEETDWHRLVCWGSLAELFAKHLKKGSHILVTGRLKTRNYEDKNSVVHYVTEIYADQVVFLDKAENS